MQGPERDRKLNVRQNRVKGGFDPVDGCRSCETGRRCVPPKLM